MHDEMQSSWIHVEKKRDEGRDTASDDSEQEKQSSLENSYVDVKASRPSLQDREDELIAILNKIQTMGTSQENNAPLTRCAFTIIDKDKKLRQYLKQYHEDVCSVYGPFNTICYDRSPDKLGSSHLLGSPKQYGMDFRGQDQMADSRPVLPHKKTHLLWGEVADSDNVFIKFEPIGCGNLKDQISHGLHFAESSASKVAEDARREKDIKPEIKKAYEDSCKEKNVKPLKFDKPGTLQRGVRMLSGYLGAKHEIPYNTPSISAMLKHLQDAGADKTNFLTECKNAGYNVETLQHRFGNEVVLEVDFGVLLDQVRDPDAQAPDVSQKQDDIKKIDSSGLPNTCSFFTLVGNSIMGTWHGSFHHSTTSLSGNNEGKEKSCIGRLLEYAMKFLSFLNFFNKGSGIERS